MGGAPFETELKFQVPAERRAALLRALAGPAGAARPGIERVRMMARYFDTPDGRLAAAGLALRLRREGRTRWVQTLKGRGDGLMQRLEHEVVLPARTRPALDLSRHDGTPVGAALRTALDGQDPVERFATDIVRTRRVLRTRGPAGAAQVELAFDEGHIRAGSAERAVCEIEFELVSGAPQALLALAARWVARHGLWLDVRSKAEMGHRLAAARPAAATPAQPPIVSARMGPQRALAALLQSCLAQVLPNLAEVAGPGGPADPCAQAEALHQLRVGLRRTRTALREFGRDLVGVDPAWDRVLAEAARALGLQRDRDVAAAALAPACAAARSAGYRGVPDSAPTPSPAPSSPAPAALLQATALNIVLLDLIGRVLEAHDAPGAASWQARACRRLQRLHRSVTTQGADFDALPDEARHRLRRRAKRLRYTLEFSAPLFGRKSVRRYLGPLRELQQSLGDYNDLGLADAWLDARAPDPQCAAFLRGWVVARRAALAAQCALALHALGRAARPWK